MNLHTMGEQHLVYAYVAVWLLQLGYLGWILSQWRKTGR